MKDHDDKREGAARGGREISREEARRKRERFLAQAREQALADSARYDDANGEDAEPTVATMILPGD